MLTDLRKVRPGLIVHDSACLWGAIAARELKVPAAASFTTFAFNRRVPSPTRGSWSLLAEAAARPRTLRSYLRSRRGLRRAFDTRGLPMLDMGNIRQPLNLDTSRSFQPAVEDFDESYRSSAEHGARPADPSFPSDRLTDPVLYASLGTVFNADPQLLRCFATALARWVARSSSRPGRPIPTRWVRCRPMCSPAVPFRNRRCWPVRCCSSRTAE